MSDVVAWMRTFVRVVEAGSFTAVAEERNTSQPTISRQVAQLEDHLGSLLFLRSTRALALTDDGQVFYNHALRTLESLTEAEMAVGRRKGKPSGTLRITCTSVLARLHIVPRLERFLARYPEIEIEFMIGDSQLDLVAEGIDIAIRGGRIGDDTLIARRLGNIYRHVVATPAYLDKHGRPQTLEDLTRHECILFSGVESTWSFANGNADSGGPVAIPVHGRLRFNNTDSMREAVLRGLGIGFLPLWHLTGDLIESGKLEILLAHYKAETIPINAVYPSRRHLAPKVRAAIDFLVAEFEVDPLLTSYGD
jgi:DNA-binding transcriptional LysR family regulator